MLVGSLPNSKSKRALLNNPHSALVVDGNTSLWIGSVVAAAREGSERGTYKIGLKLLKLYLYYINKLYNLILIMSELF